MSASPKKTTTKKGLSVFFAYIQAHPILKHTLIIAGVAMLLITAVLFWLDEYTLHNKAIKVPDVRSLQVDAAAPILDRNTLRYEVVDSVYTENVPKGAVVEQVPRAGALVKEGRIVFLTMNARGSRLAILPDVTELSQRQAVAMIEAAGFKVEAVRYVPYQYRDLVVSVTRHGRALYAGSKQPYNTPVILQVGDGFETPLENDSTLEEGGEVNSLYTE